MNLREDLRRSLQETNQVMQTRRYKWLSAIGLLLLFVGNFHVFDPEYWQLRRVRRHIADISPQWDAFKRANPGFEAVELFPMNDSAWGVVFAARGKISPNVNLIQLSEFMWSTQPPSSVDVDKVATDFSGLPRSPIMRKVPTLTPDGRRIENDAITEAYPGWDIDTPQSKAEPGGPASGSQSILSETNSTSSAAGSPR